MKEFTIPPEIKNKFTPERLKQMEKEADEEIEKEKIRSGELTRSEDVIEPEKFVEQSEAADKAALFKANKIKSRPQSKFVKMPPAPKNMGWLKAWQDEQERKAEEEIRRRK